MNKNDTNTTTNAVEKITMLDFKLVTTADGVTRVEFASASENSRTTGRITALVTERDLREAGIDTAPLLAVAEKIAAVSIARDERRAASREESEDIHREMRERSARSRVISDELDAARDARTAAVAAT